MMFGVWTVLLILVIVHVSQAFTDDDLVFVTSVHGAFCGKERLCTNHENQIYTNFTTVKRIDELSVPLPDSTNPKCCKPCSCDSNTCLDFGDCCPDVLNNLPTIGESMKPTRAACQGMTLKGAGAAYRVYNLCDKRYKGENNDTAETKSKCENPKNYFDFDTKQPVIDSESRRIYANRYCATCGFVPDTNLVYWLPRLFCHYGSVFNKSSNVNTIVQDILNTQHCDIQFLWPEELSYGAQKCRKVTSECNRTGEWLEYDPVVEAACYAYRSIYASIWNNVFCFLCNERRLHLDLCDITIQDGIAPVSFGAILRFVDEPVVQNEGAGPSDCSSAQVYDNFKSICRNLSCTFPRLLQNRECVNAGDQIIGLAYRLHLKLKPVEVHHATTLDDLASMVNIYGQSELVTKWDNWMALANVTLFYKLTPEEGSTASVMVSTSTTESSREAFTRQLHPTSTDTSNQQETDIEHNSTLNSDKVNTFGISQLSSDLSTPVPASTVEYFLLQIEWNFFDTVSYPHPADFIDTLLDLDRAVTTLSDPKNETSAEFYISIHDYLRNDHFYPIDPTTNSALLTYPLYITLPKGERLNDYMPNILPLTHALVCPLVEIDNDEYKITEYADGIFIAELGETFDRKNIRITNGINVSVYSICKTMFMSVTERYAPSPTTPSPREVVVEPQGILSVVFACTSILFCLLTLITYALFPELRTQPGINNMLLCICLLCAQILFTFAAPQSDNVSKTVCAFLGGIVHFFWLMVIFAMNACSYHMFVVFIQKSSNDIKIRSKFVRTTLYTIFCVLASLLFVTINIIVGVFDSETAVIGYGDVGMCYLSRRSMIGYTFALPVGVVISVNFLFFIIVMIKIGRLPNVSSTITRDRNYFSIYVRLSTLTGLTWIFGFVYEVTKQVVFEYLFIIFNGGMGVLIFISFVCNKRTYKLFKGRFLMSRTSTRTK